MHLQGGQPLLRRYLQWLRISGMFVGSRSFPRFRYDALRPHYTDRNK